MKQYYVTWAIDIVAETPREAAELAREAQTRKGTIATVFDVFECKEDGGARLAHIDLTYPEDSEHFTTDDLKKGIEEDNTRQNQP